MEGLGGALAIFLMLTATAVMIGVLKAIWFWITRKTKSLPSKTSPVATTSPTKLLEPNWLPDDNVRQQILTRHCTLHGKQCIGLALVNFLAPPSASTMMNPLSTCGDRDVGRTYVDICEACIPDATSLLAQGFVWRRSNYALHPQWGSDTITRHLLYDRYCRVISVRRISSDGNTWVECVPDSPRDLERQDTVATTHTSAEDVVAQYAPSIASGCGFASVLHGRDIPEKAIRTAITHFAHGASEETPLLLIGTGFRTFRSGFLLTGSTLYGKQDPGIMSPGITIQPGPSAIPLHNIRSVDIISPCPDVLWTVLINGTPFVDTVLGRPAIDHFVTMLRQLSGLETGEPLGLADNASTASQHDTTGSTEAGSSKCPQCGHAMAVGETLVCRHCGRVDWGTIVVVSALSLARVS